MFHRVFILTWLWGTRECEMAHCSYYKYQTTCRIEGGYVWKPGANFFKYSFSPFPTYSFLDTRPCSAAEWGPQSRTESRAGWLQDGEGGKRANEGSLGSVLSSAFCFSSFHLVVP